MSTPTSHLGRTFRAMAGLAALCLAGAGCSSGGKSSSANEPTPRPSTRVVASGPPTVPAGFTTFDGKDFSFAYPQGWQLVERPGNDGPLVIVEGPVLSSAEIAQQFIVGTQANYAGDLDLVVNAFEFLRAKPGQTKIRDERVQLPSGVPAQLTELSFDMPVKSGANERLRTRELRLVTPDKKLIVNVARTTDVDFDASAMPKIFDSFRVKA